MARRKDQDARRAQLAEATERAVLARGLGVDDVGDYLDRRQGRWGRPDEVAEVAVHLVEDATAFTSGLLYAIDNGGSAS